MQHKERKKEKSFKLLLTLKKCTQSYYMFVCLSVCNLYIYPSFYQTISPLSLSLPFSFSLPLPLSLGC